MSLQTLLTGLEGMRRALDAGGDFDVDELEALLDATRAEAEGLNPAELADLAAAVVSLERSAAVQLTEARDSISRLSFARHAVGAYGTALRPHIRGQRLRTDA